MTSKKMLGSVSLWVVALGAAGGIGCGGEATGPQLSGDVEEIGAVNAAICPPAAPSPSLVVPSGERLAFSFDAVGVQIYACAASGSGVGWVFQAPEATLLNPGGQTAGTHFAGPTWQANDGSQVVGARVASVTVDPSAVPWLLLSAASHAGAGRMAKVSFIQRFETVGGTAPAAGCDATTAGALSRVPYQATYYFYEPKQGAPQGPSCP